MSFVLLTVAQKKKIKVVKGNLLVRDRTKTSKNERSMISSKCYQTTDASEAVKMRCENVRRSARNYNGDRLKDRETIRPPINSVIFVKICSMWFKKSRCHNSVFFAENCGVCISAKICFRNEAVCLSRSL